MSRKASVNFQDKEKENNEEGGVKETITKKRSILKKSCIETFGKKRVKLEDGKISKKASSKTLGRVLKEASKNNSTKVKDLDRKVKDFRFNRQRNEIILNEVNFLYNACNKMRQELKNTSEGSYPIYEKQMLQIGNYIVSEYPRSHNEKEVQKNITYRNSLIMPLDPEQLKKLQNYNEALERKGSRLLKFSTKSLINKSSKTVGKKSTKSARKRSSKTMSISSGSSSSTMKPNIQIGQNLNKEEEKVKEKNYQENEIMKKFSISSDMSFPFESNPEGIKVLKQDLNAKQNKSSSNLPVMIDSNLNVFNKKESNKKVNSSRKESGVNPETAQKINAEEFKTKKRVSIEEENLYGHDKKYTPGVEENKNEK